MEDRLFRVHRRMETPVTLGIIQILLFQWILDRPPLATTMPAFRGTLSEEEVAQVLAYIKSSWLPEIQDRQNEGSVQYEAQVVEFGSE